MGQLIYTAITSLDGYLTDADGNFDWAAPDAEVHAFVNELERPISTHLYGRRMYEVMVYWETAPEESDSHPVEQAYARIWQAADKIVYSSTLAAPTSARTRIERSFEPEAVRRLKDSVESDLGVGGAHLAASAFAAGLVDEVRLFLAPVAVGGGTAALPAGARVDLELLDERRFDSGFVYLRYACR